MTEMTEKLTRNPFPSILGWAAALFLLVPGPWAAERVEGRDARPAYTRGDAQRPKAPAPGRRAPMPEELRRAGEPEKAGGPDREGRGAASTRPGQAGRPRVDDSAARLLDRAREAGLWAAERQLEAHGVAEYYRAGFFVGQRDALADPRLGVWDFREGRRFALGDPEARRSGLEEGGAAAQDLALRLADRRVREQFMNLAAEPRFDAYAPTPAWEAQSRPVAGPTLAEVFADFPLARFGRPDFVPGLSIDAVRLSGYASHADFFGRDWDDPAVGFRAWMDSPRRSAFFRSLEDPEDRRRFRAEFDVAFGRSLDRLGSRRLERSFDRGFDDGFDYGAFVHQELDYRRGYFEGFQLALERATDEGFRRTFPRSFETAYGEAFRDWSENPKPAIGDVRLIDEDDDGVFEPGERVIVESELINYGGRSGRFPIRLTGDVLSAGGSGERDVRLPARSVEWDRRLVARIQGDTPNRTRTSLAVQLADRSTTAPLLVSRPLQFVPGRLFAARRNLDGEVRIEVEVQNQSRLPRSGRIRMTPAEGRGASAEAEVFQLAPGKTATVELQLRGLPVLDLIAGDIGLELRVTSDGTEQDVLFHRLPDVARDLGNNDLLEYVVALGRDRNASPREVARARDLFLSRLREDWDRAVRQSGNPYKRDYKRGEAQTSLGELVQTVASARGGFGNPDVFGGLSAEVSALAGDLPGPHPFLRKYMRRLARRLP